MVLHTCNSFPHSGHTSHPYGHAVQIQKYERNDEETTSDVDYNEIYNFFNHTEINDRKVVVFSIIGAYRGGKSFFLDYCLRYLYATVS